MTDFKSKSIIHKVFARIMSCGALAACITASPLLAQDTIDGKFTLSENARFGDTLIGAGHYRFSIEPVGTIQSIHSIQEGAGHLVLVVLKPEKSGRAVSIFAMASPSGRGRETSELILEPEKAGTIAQTKYLEMDGLIVDFRWSSPKIKSQVAAQQTAPVQTASVSQSAAK
jgi:hypothetical protein